MMTISKEKKEKVEKYLQENEGAISILWGDDSITTFNEEGKTIEDFMIDFEDDGEIYYTPVSNPSATIRID